jgi:quercetin dioxygenase-like cupin family protein
VSHNGVVLDHRVMTNGRPLTAVSTTAFGLSEVRHRAGDLYRTHTHDLPYLLLVLRGAFREEVQGRIVELASGGVVVMPAGCDHRDFIDDGGMDALLVTLDEMFGRAMPLWRCFSGGPVSRAMVSLYRSFAEGGEWELLAIEELLHDVMSCADGAIATEACERRAVRAALDVLHACADRPLRLADVACEAGVAPEYLARAFKRSMGVTRGA